MITTFADSPAIAPAAAEGVAPVVVDHPKTWWGHSRRQAVPSGCFLPGQRCPGRNSLGIKAT